MWSGLSTAQRVFQDVPSARRLVFDRSPASCGCGGSLPFQPSSLDGGLLLFELFSPRRQLHHPRHQRGVLIAHRVVLCRKRRPLSLASTAFCAISRSMLACKIATDVLSPVASAACSGTRRRDSVGVTGAFRVEPRRGLSSVYLLSRPDQLRSTIFCASRSSCRVIAWSPAAAAPSSGAANCRGRRDRQEEGRH